MKNAKYSAVLFLLPLLTMGSTLNFRSPTWDSPYYRIQFPIDVNNDGLLIKGLRINEMEWDDFFIFLDGKNVDHSKPLPKGKYEVEVDFAWTGGKEYQTVLTAYPEENPNIAVIQEAKGIAPDQGGIPGGKEGFYRIFKAQESIGLDRKKEVSFLTFAVRKEDQEERPFVLFDGGNPIEYQILDTRESLPHEKAAETHPITLTYKIAFPLDIPALGQKTLLLLEGHPDFSDEIGFIITGENLGKSVKNDALSLELHPVSGQINIIESLKEGVKLYNEDGVIHWNPGVLIPGIAWDHSFDWNPPPNFDEKIGKFMYINSRRGPLQKIKDVNLEVKYILQREKPYFVSETRLVVQKDLGVLAIRNDEMVLYKELFNTLIYKNKQDRVVKMPLKEKLGFRAGLVHVVADDLDWVGLLNQQKSYGFFCLRIKYVNANLGTSGKWLNKSGTYFYAPSKGKYVYWVRPLLYPYTEYTTKNLLAFVPEGSFFYEKNAYILLPLKEGYEKELDTLLLKLRNPVRVY